MTVQQSRSASTRSRSRTTLLVVGALVLVVALLAAGWGAASVFRSPEQVAAQASPPPPSVVTAPVESGSLRRSIEVRVEFEHEREVTVALPSVADPVITKSPLEAGQNVNAGALLAELNGAPVFLLEGDFRFYRDLRVGDSGSDVTQLQRGLQRAGFDVTVDGELGAQTLNAVGRLLREAGYDLPAEPVESEPTAANTEDAPDTPRAPATTQVPYIPATTFAVAAEAPAVVTSRPIVGETGDTITPVVLAYGDVVAVAEVQGATASTLATDLEASIQVNGVATEAKVGHIAAPLEDGSVQVTIRATSPLNADLRETQAIATVFLDPPGEDGLIVPTRSVVTRGDGTSIVQVRRGNGEFVEVTVTVLESSGGRSLVLPSSDEVTADDEVRVS